MKKIFQDSDWHFVSFCNLKSLYFTCSDLNSFVVWLVVIRCHAVSFVVSLGFVLPLLPLVVIHFTACCHSLLLVVICCHSLYHSFPLVVIRCNNTRLYFLLTIQSRGRKLFSNFFIIFSSTTLGQTFKYYRAS